METTKTELHTHLMGMLTAKEFLKMVSEYVDYIFWPLDRAVNENTKLVPINDLMDNEEALSQLQIKHGDSLPYDNLDFLYITRTQIVSYILAMIYINNGKKPCRVKELLNDPDVKDIIQCYAKFYYYSDKNIEMLMAAMEYHKNTKDKNRDLENSVIGSVYSDYLNRVLQELIDMGCKYVEISFSSEKVISMINIKPEISSKIKCRFLLSTDRHRSVSQMKQSVKSLKSALNNGMTVGFDIMGQELPLTDAEKKYDTSNNSLSLKRKLELLIEVLKEKDENTLRIHSGETPESYENTEWILRTLLEIKYAYLKGNPPEKVLPPPELRIGHGLYFDENNENYFSALKEFEAIVEINASSNKALSNIEDYIVIPYDTYLSHGIPVVLSTDGHGLYDTNLEKEDRIAKENSRYYQVILEIEKEILGRKMKR